MDSTVLNLEPSGASSCDETRAKKLITQTTGWKSSESEREKQKNKHPKTENRNFPSFINPCGTFLKSGIIELHQFFMQNTENIPVEVAEDTKV